VVVIEPFGSDHGPIWRVYVNFGDHEVGPGATVGHADSVPVDESHPDGGEEITVQLPRDEIFTFWTAILRTAEQHPDLQRDCLVIIEMNESDSEVISFVVVVQEPCRTSRRHSWSLTGARMLMQYGDRFAWAPAHNKKTTTKGAAHVQRRTYNRSRQP
jgi:hypothetical protein